MRNWRRKSRPRVSRPHTLAGAGLVIYPYGYIVGGMTQVNQTPHQIHAGRAEHDHAGHGGHGDHVAQFRRLFWTMLVLTVPTVALSGMFAMILGYSVPDLPGAQWI